jgi:hypothetical protein
MECLKTRRIIGGIAGTKVSYPRDFRWLLRLCLNPTEGE